MQKYKEYIVMGTLILLFVLAVSLGRTDNNQDASFLNKQTQLSRSPGVAVISLIGPIKVTGTEFLMPGSAEVLMSLLQSYETNKQVKAVIIRVNSPGGNVGSSQEVYESIMRFRERSGKPGVVSVLDVNASGAYWISLAADHIVAHSGSLVGSLGVIAQSPDLTGIQEKYGIGMRTYKSGKMKDIMNPWRPSTKRESIVIQRMLKNIHKQFVDVLIERRKLDSQKAERIADGRVYTGEQALALGLIDELGGLEESLMSAGKLAKIKGRPRLIYPKPTGLQQVFQSIRGSASLPQLFQSLNFGVY